MLIQDKLSATWMFVFVVLGDFFSISIHKLRNYTRNMDKYN